MPYLSIFGQEFKKRILKKCLNLGPKMPYLDIFEKTCLIWVFLGKNFKKTIVVFEINTLDFV